MPRGVKNGGYLQGFTGAVKFLRFPGITIARAAQTRFDAAFVYSSFKFEGDQVTMNNGRAGVAEASCESCFFHQNLLCALSGTGPCATYRPNHPDGLRPPSQLRFVFRQERRLQVAWAFPSPSEQVALHA